MVRNKKTWTIANKDRLNTQEAIGIQLLVGLPKIYAKNTYHDVL